MTSSKTLFFLGFFILLLPLCNGEKKLLKISIGIEGKDKVEAFCQPKNPLEIKKSKLKWNETKSKLAKPVILLGPKKSFPAPNPPIPTAGQPEQLFKPGEKRIKPGKPGTLDRIFEKIKITLNAKNPGKKSYTFSAPGKAKVTASLSTYGNASIKVLIKKKDGTVINWMQWDRTGDKDRSPLYLDGKAVSNSIYEQSPGDYSAKPVTFEYPMQEGDAIELSLTGNFGAANPLLKFEPK
ncbi:hypothetical protein ACFL35_13270 [Candidatus Riflebacteria bacterium]